MSDRTPAERALHNALYFVAGAASGKGNWPPGCHYACPQDFVLQHGRWYPPGDLTPYPEQGQPKCCFGNAIMLCVKRPGLVYVEGYALTPHHGVPVHHAWCSGPEGTAIDITWQPPGTAYLGVEFSLERADDATWHGDASVLDDWKRRWPLYREPWQGERPLTGYEPSPALIAARRFAQRLYEGRKRGAVK